MQDKIIIKGAREHNLKNISLELPRNKMIVFTGLSGSGKSSLAFDTIFAEGQRRYIESLSAYARQFLGKMDKPDVDEIEGLAPAISIDQKAHSANPRSTVATITEIYDYLRVLFARVGEPFCPVCKKKIQKMTVQEMVDVVLQKLEKEKIKSEDKLIIFSPIIRGRKGEYYQLLYDLYNKGFSEVAVDGKAHKLSEKIKLSRYKQHDIDLVIRKLTIAYPIQDNKVLQKELSEAIETSLEESDGLVKIAMPSGENILLSSKYSCPNDNFAFPEIEPRLFSFNSPYGACEYCHGIGTKFIFSDEVCPKCLGKRLKTEALHVLIGEKNINDVVNMSISEAVDFFSGLKLSAKQKEIAEAALREIKNRLTFMLDVGLNYLTLNRKAGTLSGGEAQRIRLASQVGSRLVGALYVLDEPTIGLHQRDNERLLKTLSELRDIGNTVIVVEHDEDTILMSDYMVDIGPSAGKNGGEIMAIGTLQEVLKNKNSLTAKYLRGELKVPMPESRRKNIKEKIVISGATEHNLKNIKVEIPLKKFVCLTGVSGSGKSTLMNDILYRAASKKINHSEARPGAYKKIEGLSYIDRVIVVDQSAIGRTPRSNPATYTGCWTYIRELFSTTPEARARGYKVGRFSFNRPGGRCEHCEGNGTIAIEMHFLPTVYVKCDVCKGKRFDRETLEIRYKGKNIADILDMEIDEADEFFKNIPHISDKLKVLRQVGLGYLELGQGAPTLSGGEAQRVKLAKELSKYYSLRFRQGLSRSLYLLDEPTVGLHYDDVKKLVAVLQELVSAGNTVLIIEHNLDIIKNADYIIDLGPEGGDKGGEIIATGTPEEVARMPKSYTGQYLRKVLGI
ncbi:MAG: excinuclease ABC subunit A [Parcubacteria group bacterium CG10_big_fil_rev_8_21_14_0_10_36_14]|nr:MAG: excinuclease ABC subunit A [Parcubacteria group bacterium CG10_big_fil_rev_8_21_14_0_10_36_14]